MKLPRNLHLRTFLFIVLMIAFGASGDVVLSKGMKQLGPVSLHSLSGLFPTFWRTFTSGTIWLGILLLLAFFGSYISVLTWADYSFVQPAAASSYVVVALAGAVILRETVSPIRWAGILLICAGVMLVGGTPPRTTETP